MCRINSILPEACTRFYAIWCITWGLLIGCGYSLLLILDLSSPKAKLDLLERILSIAYALMGLSYGLAGAFMFLGMHYDKPTLFKCGKLLSSIFAIATFPVIFISVVHCSSMRCMCQYMKERWNKG
ncbi:uncharacterized protein [Drosophila takahashii]|uniref:uncharacterized protein n=1 Tax=Drosophila takahashii TaxID=29030 RepID=UPI001CF81569|nr:uncharacterized protein LOC108057144 [Drosophila takahashii]